MKFTTLRASAALALLATLAACGGKAMFDVNVTITGLNNPNLVLSNGSDRATIPAGSSSYTFSRRIPYGEDYNVVVEKSPDHMTCKVMSGGSGSAGHFATINAVVACEQNVHALSGRVSNLSGANMILLNGNVQVAVAPTTPPTPAVPVDFTFPSVADGTSYGITVLKQPDGQTCTVTNGTGVMHETDIANVSVACVAN
ncbi:hypothetical protein HSX11_12775 [Oxalobacteraceae bacterium]|nr:hypothetical protein [Oxalobacteraceae bacterium]